ncbi:MAG: hypothetical protein MZV63_18145 [Marinilabiliales bacterium]|nr:hypothetical protein [Marinilabiliales bacterium]
MASRSTGIRAGLAAVHVPVPRAAPERAGGPAVPGHRHGPRRARGAGREVPAAQVGRRAPGQQDRAVVVARARGDPERHRRPREAGAGRLRHHDRRAGDVLAGCRARVGPDQEVLPLPPQPRGRRHDLLRRDPDGPRRVAQRADWRREPGLSGRQAPGHRRARRHRPAVERGGAGTPRHRPHDRALRDAHPPGRRDLRAGAGGGTREPRSRGAMDSGPDEPAHAGRGRRNPALVGRARPDGRRAPRRITSPGRSAFWIHAVIASSAAGAIVSSICAYSAGRPVLAVWSRWFSPGRRRTV